MIGRSIHIHVGMNSDAKFAKYAGSALGLILAGKGVRMNAARPNILFILTDDQGPWALGCAGNKEIHTPNLDRLAESGTRFDSFFCASPVCSPARATIVTGRIPSAHGVLDWLRTGSTIAKYEPDGQGRLIEYLQGMPGYTDYLADAGYLCALSGKWHLGDSHHPQKGFSFWEVHAKGGGPYCNAPMVHDGEAYEEPRYVTDAITDNALRFLDEEWTGEQPFYLSVHYTAPHSPWNRENHPAELWDDYFENCPFDFVPNMVAPPGWVYAVQRQIKTPEKRRELLSGYYAAVTAMDSNVGRLLDWLEAHSLREDTLVVFMGDNGMCMGHHGVYGKGNATAPLNMFEESVKVPCIISHPGRVPAGKVCSELLSQYDFMPTLLDYVGIENPQAETLPGKSFVPLLLGESSGGREQVVVFDEYGPVRMVRTKDWKYVHRYPDGPNELYDLRTDPGEQTNLVSDPAYASTVREMRGRLEDWFRRWGDPVRDGAQFIITGAGQAGLIGGPEGAKFYGCVRDGLIHDQ